MSKLAWLVLGSVLTLVLYLPVWLIFGHFFYHGIHPDYWVYATPAYVFPVAALVSAALLYLGKLVFLRK
ncbi:MAG: hypothetical protein ACKOVA_17725 [Novosphingobium sp.]